MKTPPSFCFCLFIAAIFLLPVPRAFPAPGFIYESPTEFTAAGDFNGDGREDLVVADRATGHYRLGYQQADGSFQWASTRASGIPNLTGFSVGRVFSTSRDSLVFTAPEANRINLCDAANSAAASSPVFVAPLTIGPSFAVAIDVGGAGNTPHDDLAWCSLLNGPPTPMRLGLMRSDGTTFADFAGGPVPVPVARGNRVILKPGVAPRLALLARGVSIDAFRLYDLANGTLAIFLQSGGLSPGSDYAYGAFGGPAVTQFLFYLPGEASGLLRVRPLLETVPGTFNFGAETAFPFGTTIRQMFVLSLATGGKLLVLFGNGETAGVYDFNGVSPPTLLQTLAAPAGELFTGAAPLASGNFTLLSAPPGAERSTRFQEQRFNGTSFVTGATGDLPRLNALSGSANVFEFAGEPFVRPSPLIRSLNAGDWTSRMTRNSGQLGVTVESFVSETAGLDHPTPTTLGPVASGSATGLVNQFTAALSLFGLGPARGDEVTDPIIFPSPGAYRKAISVVFTAAAGTQVYYRLNPAADWSLYGDGPVTLFQNTTLTYFARETSSNRKSALRQAAYTFATEPGKLDSDGDGVPDFVEVAKGLNPNRGADSDGDGYSDLDELLAGTNPALATSRPPTNHVRPDLKGAFDLIQSPRPFDGVRRVTTTSALGTELRAFDLQGNLRGFARCTNLAGAGVTNPAAPIVNVTIDTRQRLLAVGTQAHFDLSGDTNRLGRELIGLVPVPAVPAGLSVAYAHGGGDPAVEAAGWIAAAQAAFAAQAHERIVGELDLTDTLAALLVEEKVRGVLLARGQAEFADLTLFPFRGADGGRPSLSRVALLALEARDTDGQAGFALTNIHAVVSNQLQRVAAGRFVHVSLRNLATEIYRISSAFLGTDPNGLASPVDALRAFLRTGALDPAYRGRTTMTDAALADALASVSTILRSIQARPFRDLTLVVRADTFQGDCTLLDTPAFQTWSLFHPSGAPYRMLESFQLPPGVRVRVAGYTDSPNHGCAGAAIEVISLDLDLASIPVVSANDSDSDLLNDDWERLVFGDLSQNAGGDLDRDGFSNLQEFLDHTEPKDGQSHAVTVRDLRPPAVALQVVSGQLRLAWDWPAAYGSRIRFTVLSADALGQSFGEIAGVSLVPNGDHFEAALPTDGPPARFFRVALTLR